VTAVMPLAWPTSWAPAGTSFGEYIMPPQNPVTGPLGAS
jgi:hypothetical protein